jgi:dihydrofolate reductase
MENNSGKAIISYYFAISLDGYLARNDDSVDWLSRFDQDFDTPFSYKKYYQSVNAVIIGK